MGQLFCTAVSPDNIPLHFFFFFYLGLYYIFTAENLKYFRVKNFIEEVAISITAEMCQNIFQCFYERLQICIDSNGTSVEKYKFYLLLNLLIKKFLFISF